MIVSVPWEDRPEWTDVQPLPQDDGPNPLVPIAYHPDYQNAMDAFRYLMSTGERSTRGVELSEAIIRLNPGHYSVWAFRSECLLESKADLSQELDLLDELVKLYLKSYQIWQHRRTIVLALDDPSRELGFTAKALAIDSKNYHTWAYRQWILCHFWGPNVSDTRRAEASRIWDGEVLFVESLLEADVRNNSAWNHRFFVTFECDSAVADYAALVDREVRYTQSKISLAPSNASAWNYYRGVLSTARMPMRTVLPFARPFAALRAPIHLAVEFVADALAESEVSAERKEAAELFTTLADELDPIRGAYYRYRLGTMVSVT